jgi:hypothetical protein
MMMMCVVLCRGDGGGCVRSAASVIASVMARQ